MMPPPPRSTLFPYTTLFRSLITEATGSGTRVVGFYALDRGQGRVVTIAAKIVVLATGGASKVYLYTRDRKSTRLNSSHVEISYAVFCLKKKKKNNTNQVIIT